MTTQRSKSDEQPTKTTGGDVAPAETEDDVEGHDMSLMNPALAWELSKARERDIARDTARHSLIAEAKARARKKT